MQKKLTKLQAYNAMIIFLDQYYIKNKSENLSDFITYAFFLFDKKTADPAAWPEWLEVLSKTALQDPIIMNLNRLTSFQACNVMVNFFTNYCNSYLRVPSDMVDILDILKELQKNKTRSFSWKVWICAIKSILVKKDPRFYIQIIKKIDEV